MLFNINSTKILYFAFYTIINTRRKVKYKTMSKKIRLREKVKCAFAF